MVELRPIVIFGTGAMAMLFGARLARSGHPVTLCGHWAAALEALHERGVRVEGRGRTWSVGVDARLGSDTPARPASLVLVLVKSHQTERAAAELGHWLSDSGTALTLQNGLGNREALERQAERTVSVGVTTAAARLVAPGHIAEVATGRTVLGAELEEVAKLLSAAGFEAVTSRNVGAHLWLKLAVNCAINPVTALEGITNGELLDRPESRGLAIAAAGEVAAVAAACGVQLPADAAQQMLAVARRTAANASSMLQDVRRGAPTEIEALCGAVVSKGGALGVPTPVNAELLLRVRRLGSPSAIEPAEQVVA